jgi:hypothetical protein
VLRDNDYDPRTDIARDWQGVYQLTGNKPRLRDQIRAYFRDRNEDSPELSAQERHLCSARKPRRCPSNLLA